MFDFHDEVACGSHLLMAGFMAFVGLILLRRTRRHTLGQRLAVAVFALSAVGLYSASGLFHSIKHATPESRRYWQLLDQTAIFGLIYGSNVPILVYLLRPRARNPLLIGMGLLAVAGAACLWSQPNHKLLVCLYLALGITGLLPLRAYHRRVGWGGMWWVFLLAFFYVAGGVCEALSWPTFIPGFLTYHEMLHIADIMGTLAHLTLLTEFVLPTGDRTFAPPPRIGEGAGGG